MSSNAAVARRLHVVAEAKAVKTPRKAPSGPPKASVAARRRVECLSYVVGLGCLVGLTLSGIDSTFALMRFVHVHGARAAMLAIVVDFLMVGAELATLLSPCPKAKKFANIYIGMAGTLSVGLNASEFACHATSLYGMILNGLVGGSVPLLVLVSARYSGYLYLSSK